MGRAVPVDQPVLAAELGADNAVFRLPNAIESINMSWRKESKTRASLPSDEAVSKLFYLALNKLSKKWTMPLREWQAALHHFTIEFEDRLLPT